MQRLLSLPNHTTLLIIDAQKRLFKAINNKEHVVFNLSRLTRASNLLNVPKSYTEQNPIKLGGTIDILKDNPKDICISKMEFSCINCSELVKTIKTVDRDSVVLSGVETHVCIQQTALDFLQEGLNVFIPIDAVGSRNQLDHETAIKRLRSSGAIVTTTESIIFEWCQTANRKEFREISSIIKEEADK